VRGTRCPLERTAVLSAETLSRLFPIVLHEVGHWFGLPHVESDVGPDGRDEVMFDSGGTDSVCISSAALNMVEAAVDRSWSYRLTGPWSPELCAALSSPLS